MGLNGQQENLGETLARELKQPVEIGSTDTLKRLALPPGWQMKEYDDTDEVLAAPKRKRVCVQLNDLQSFISYIINQGGTISANATLWAHVDYLEGSAWFEAILDDNGSGPDDTGWRDHLAKFSPVSSAAWREWFGNNTKPFSQVDFAAFIEKNMGDFTMTTANDPSGAQMLSMALDFEANQERRFKSAIRLTNGNVQMSFTESDDDQTIQRMELFTTFTLGIPVHWGGSSYKISARLRWRVRDCRVTFWYELIQPERCLEDAIVGMIDTMKSSLAGVPFYFGDPNP